MERGYFSGVYSVLSYSYQIVFIKIAALIGYSALVEEGWNQGGVVNGKVKYIALINLHINQWI